MKTFPFLIDFSFEMARFLSSNVPKVLLQMMMNIDSDFSNDDFDGFIH